MNDPRLPVSYPAPAIAPLNADERAALADVMALATSPTSSTRVKLAALKIAMPYLKPAKSGNGRVMDLESGLEWLRGMAERGG